MHSHFRVQPNYSVEVVLRCVVVGVVTTGGKNLLRSVSHFPSTCFNFIHELSLKKLTILLVILVMDVRKSSLLWGPLHLVPPPHHQAVHHLQGVVARALQHKPRSNSSGKISCQEHLHCEMKPLSKITSMYKLGQSQTPFSSAFWVQKDFDLFDLTNSNLT